MITTIAVIAAIAEQNKVHRSWRSLSDHMETTLISSDSSDRSDNDRWDRTFSISAIVVTAKVVSTWSLSLLRSLNFYFSQRSQQSQRWQRSYAFCSTLKPGFHMIATIAVIAAITGKCFPYDRYDRCDPWPCFFSAITAIITIIWKPGFTDDVSLACC